jgi:hypothetical protein
VGVNRAIGPSRSTVLRLVRALVLAVAMVATTSAVVSAATANALVGTSTGRAVAYDISTIARIGVHLGVTAEADPARLSRATDGSVSPSTEAWGCVYDLAPRLTLVGVSRSRYPQSAAHIDDAQVAGHTTQLTIDRSGAAARRRASMEGQPVDQVSIVTSTRR